MSKPITLFAVLLLAATGWQCSGDSTDVKCGQALPLYNVRDAGADVDVLDSAAYREALEAGCITAPVPPPIIN